MTSEELMRDAAVQRQRAAMISASAAVPERAAARLSAAGLKQAHRSTDSRLRRYTEAVARAETLEHKAGLAEARERETARVRFTDRVELAGATHVRDRHGWHAVVRVNAKSVTVKTAYSWTDSIPLAQVFEAARIDGAGAVAIRPAGDGEGR
jgi:hypothetical protein